MEEEKPAFSVDVEERPAFSVGVEERSAFSVDVEDRLVHEYARRESEYVDCKEMDITLVYYSNQSVCHTLRLTRPLHTPNMISSHEFVQWIQEYSFQKGDKYKYISSSLFYPNYDRVYSPDKEYMRQHWWHADMSTLLLCDYPLSPLPHFMQSSIAEFFFFFEVIVPKQKSILKSIDPTKKRKKTVRFCPSNPTIRTPPSSTRRRKQEKNVLGISDTTSL